MSYHNKNNKNGSPLLNSNIVQFLNINNSSLTHPFISLIYHSGSNHSNPTFNQKSLQLQLRMLDLDKIGPDWKLAEDHGTACKPGRPIRVPSSSTSIAMLSQKLPKGHNLCECCLNILHKQSIPLCQNSKQLQFLGFGFPLYFIFTKYAIILLTLQIVTYSALSICWALNSSVDICDEGHVRHFPNGAKGDDGVCTSWLIRFMRTENQVTRDEIILRLSSFVIHIMGLLYMRDTIKKTNDYYDERTTSLSDYSVIINNLPKQAGTERRIKQFMKLGVGKQFAVEELIVLNHLEDYYQIREEKHAIIKQKQSWLKRQEGEQRTRHLAELDQRLNESNDRLTKQHDEQVALINKDQAICQKVVLVMQSEDAKNQFLQLWQQAQKERLVQFFGAGGEQVEIDEAPQPKEIIWENINYPADKRFIRLIVGWSLTVLFIAAVTGIFYAILMAKGHAVQQSLKDLKQHPQDPEGEILHKRAMAATILTMLAIIFFNKFCLSFVLHLFTDIQKHRTGSEYQFSFGLKYTLGLFFTTALMTLLVEDFALHNIYKQEYGVVEEESMMYFFNSFLVPIIWLLNPWYLFKLAKRVCFKDNAIYTQREANALMQNPKYSMGKKYAQLIQSVWFTYLYYSIIPGGTVLILLGLVFFYWVDKYTLLRRSSINQNVNGELSMRAMKLIDATLIMRAVGELIFDYQIRDGIGWQPILCACIGGVYLILPIDSILQFFHEEKFRAEEKPYKEVKSTFLQNYRTLHPLYAKERYALISGIDIMTQMATHTNNFLLNETQCFNDSKQEIFNPIDVVRQARMELNNTTQQMIEIRPAKNALLQMQ